MPVTDDILASMDDKELSATILLHLSKAFDSVDHNILQRKSSTIGVLLTSVKWFQTYLSERA